MKVLITGGAGYIGSTIASNLLDEGIIPVILDSLVHGAKEFVEDHIFYEGDIADKELLTKIFEENDDIFCTIHCAGLIIVPESVEMPYLYYKENVSKSLELFNNLLSLNKKKIIFSSSASVYLPEGSLLVDEYANRKADCPYANTKIIIEDILRDFSIAYGMEVISLRYFNPIGADPKFRTGPYVDNPSHLLGILVDVASGRRDVFNLTGTDWDTRDGSAIRDYIHIWDLANAHVEALKNIDTIFKDSEIKYTNINIGTGLGVTVKEFVTYFEEVIDRQINKKNMPPRPGDKVGAYASADKAEKLLGWKAKLSIKDAIRDALRWDKEKTKILKK